MRLLQFSMAWLILLMASMSLASDTVLLKEVSERAGELKRSLYRDFVEEKLEQKNMEISSMQDQLKASDLSDDEGWLLMKDRNGIQIYAKHDAEDRLKTFRGITEIEVEDPNAIFHLAEDYEALANMLQYVGKIEDIERYSNFDRDVRVFIDLPWPLTDRDAILRGVFINDSESHRLDIDLYNQAELMPEETDYIRVPDVRGKVRFQYLGDKRMQVMYQVVIDMGAYIPSWLVNIILQDTPYFTLKRVETVLANPKYHSRADDKPSSQYQFVLAD